MFKIVWEVILDLNCNHTTILFQSSSRGAQIYNQQGRRMAGGGVGGVKATIGRCGNISVTDFFPTPHLISSHSKKDCRIQGFKEMEGLKVELRSS